MTSIESKEFVDSMAKSLVFLAKNIGAKATPTPEGKYKLPMAKGECLMTTLLRNTGSFVVELCEFSAFSVSQRHSHDRADEWLISLEETNSFYIKFNGDEKHQQVFDGVFIKRGTPHHVYTTSKVRMLAILIPDTGEFP